MQLYCFNEEWEQWKQSKHVLGLSGQQVPWSFLSSWLASSQSNWLSWLATLLPAYPSNHWSSHVISILKNMQGQLPAHLPSAPHQLCFLVVQHLQPTAWMLCYCHGNDCMKEKVKESWCQHVFLPYTILDGKLLWHLPISVHTQVADALLVYMYM